MYVCMYVDLCMYVQLLLFTRMSFRPVIKQVEFSCLLSTYCLSSLSRQISKNFSVWFQHYPTCTMVRIILHGCSERFSCLLPTSIDLLIVIFNQWSLLVNASGFRRHASVEVHLFLQADTQCSFSSEPASQPACSWSTDIFIAEYRWLSDYTTPILIISI